MAEPLTVGLFTAGWGVAKDLFTGFRALKKDRREKVVQYFEAIADTLEAMVQEFEQFRVPYEAGHSLGKLLPKHHEISKQVYGKAAGETGSEVSALFDGLESMARRARMMDAILEGSGERGTEVQKQFLRDMRRLIGDYRGLAATLRSAPA